MRSEHEMHSESDIRDVSETDTHIVEETLNNSVQSFQQRQDSIRQFILEDLPNTAIKESVFQEAYIKGLVDEIGGIIKVEVPFDLHGLDCGAPDCYSTDVSFQFEAKAPFELPASIDVSVHEHGCIELPVEYTTTFQLIKNKHDKINYYSVDRECNLIFKLNSIYFYIHGNDQPITVDYIDSLYATQYFEHSESVPYQSTSMIRNEYEFFVR